MKGGLACRDDGLAMVDLTGSRAIGWMEDSSALGANSLGADLNRARHFSALCRPMFRLLTAYLRQRAH